MSSTISVEIPREVVHAARMTPRDLKRELAIYLHQQGKLSFGKAREMAGMSGHSNSCWQAGKFPFIMTWKIMRKT